jgi:hypothetical protein
MAERLLQQYLRTPAVPGGGFERPNPLIAGGPDPNALIQIRDRLAAHLEALAPTARWCICPIYTIGPDPRRFASSRAAIEEPHTRGSK